MQLMSFCYKPTFGERILDPYFLSKSKITEIELCLFTVFGKLYHFREHILYV